MSSGFVGRADDLHRLDDHLTAVRQSGEGRMVVVRGRRQVGKSRLVNEAVSRAGVPHLFFTGSRQATAGEDLQRFVAEARRSGTLPGRDVITAGHPSSWDDALRLLAAAVPAHAPSIVVLDEFPWLLERDPGLEGSLQAVWDRELERLPVLLVLIGSDLAVMDAITSYGRPLYGRPRVMLVRPFTPRDTARMLGLEQHAGDAIDAQLVTGGYPRLITEASRHPDLASFVQAQLSDENSDLAVTGARVLAAEFPTATQASLVLNAIGSGERTFRNIRQTTGLADQVVSRSLTTLVDKGVVARDVPVALKPADQPRYRIDDPYLRFFLSLVAPYVDDIARGRADLALSGYAARWASWRGRAVEPLVRDALTRLAATDDRLAGAAVVGGWWPRSNDPEIDLVGADKGDHPGRLCFAGSIKWRQDAPFTADDTRALLNDLARTDLPRDLPLVGVARTAVADPSVIGLTAADLLTAWA